MKVLLQETSCYIVFFIFPLLHGAYGLFENCDDIYRLDGTKSLTLTSTTSLNSRNVTSCRYTIIAEANHIIKVMCKLKFDQEDSQNCLKKRFFVSVDGIVNLHRAQNFCNRNGTTRVLRRRSISNRLVMAYVSKTDLNDDNFTCTVTKINTQCECGWSRQARIFNGTNAQMHEFPSMVALLSLTLNKVFCGGVIISDRYFLTGAHCFNEEIYSDLNQIAAFVGEHDLSISNETIYTESYELEYFIRHELYDPESYLQDYDIALARTKIPIGFNLAVGPACLPFNFPHNAFDNKYVYAIGFGYLSYFDQLQASILQKVSLKILPANQCQDSQNNEKKMCTYEQSKNSCVSDSGGPLILNIRGTQFAVGLISYGIGCGSVYPSINTRITSYLDWITRNLQNESLCQK
ncbi:hypothetical protein PVAND_003742 [Polypedilum vanderplanki]|uniref:Uncharacterized protein n=1 Tax=Polypedilum vanderplanki TaxID=319348 RepID=A0A9J6BVH6_POLVA|nr:hypothetical protein PVAND_003742 [Polypedilum vanderplanki]